jgi:hypothetical protein
MKNLIFLSLMITLAIGCNSKAGKAETVNSGTAEETIDTTTVDHTAVEKPEVPKEKLYACPMHPEVTGNKGDKCPKCGMALTEPVK